MDEKNRVSRSRQRMLRLDRRAVLKLGLTVAAGGVLTGFRPGAKPTVGVLEKTAGSLSTSIGANGEVYLVQVTYQLPAAGGPFYLEVLSLDGTYFDMHQLAGQKGMIELPVDVFDIPDGGQYVLTIVDGQQRPVAGIPSAAVETPTYPELR